MNGPALDQRHQELAFFGTVTASLSHQINNVLTILNELGGLIGDMATAEPAAGLAAERFERVAERIRTNVERGTDYIRLLNRFSHAVDQEEADLELGEQLRFVAALGLRFAELKQARIEVVAPDRPLRLRTNQFRLLHLLFVCVQDALDGDGVRLVSLVLVGEARRIVVRVVGDTEARATDQGRFARLALASALAQALGASVACAGDADGRVVEIVIETGATGGEDGECT